MIRPYLRLWLPDLLIVLALAAATTAAFALTDWDQRAAAWFFHAGSPDPWPHDDRQPWSGLYRYGPWLVGLVVGGCVLAVAGSFWRPALRAWRLPAVFIALSMAIGPGLLVNSVFKDHWGRPRPRETVQFGGPWEHRAPLIDPGPSGQGKSFPSGHAAAGFGLCAFYVVLRRRRPGWAFAALGGALLLGGMLGIARMRAGGHFLSDVLFAFYIPAVTALLLYHVVLRVPWREDEAAAGRGRSMNPGLVGGALLLAAGLGLAVALLFGNPVYRDLGWTAADAGDRQWRFTVPSGDVVVEIVADAAHPCAVRGEAQGFALPGHQVRSDGGGTAYEVVQRGTFSELETRVRVVLRAADVAGLTVVQRSGSLRIAAPAGMPRPPGVLPAEGVDVHLPEGWAR